MSADILPSAVLAGAGAAAVVGAATGPAALARATSAGPDAELVRLCAQHVRNRNTYNARIDEDGEYGALFDAYIETTDAIHDAKPLTIEGMIAKARAAKAEAQLPGEGESIDDGVPDMWAWDLVNDLLRMGERMAAGLPSGAAEAACLAEPGALRTFEGAA